VPSIDPSKNPPTPCLAVRQPFRDECGLEAERAGAMEVRMVQKKHSEGVDTGKSETSTITTLPPWICCQTKANIRVLLHCVCEVSHRIASHSTCFQFQSTKVTNECSSKGFSDYRGTIGDVRIP
jgi:hypothetical protein